MADREAELEAALAAVEKRLAAAGDTLYADWREDARRSLADVAADLVRSGKLDMDSLAAAAGAAYWAHDALRQIAPDRAATICRPRRKRGRDRDGNLIRDMAIRAEVKHRMDRGASLRTACRETAAGYSEFGNQRGRLDRKRDEHIEATAWKAVAEIWRKRPIK